MLINFYYTSIMFDVTYFSPRMYHIRLGRHTIARVVVIYSEEDILEKKMMAVVKSPTLRSN